MRLLAVSDLHVGHPANREVVESLRGQPGDWLLVAGDVAEAPADIEWALATLTDRFERVVWVPGNHELWSTGDHELRGVERYDHLVALCRRLGVLTPEDPYVTIESDSEELILVPLFLLYDYSFREPGESQADAIRRAEKAGQACADEHLLHPDPFPSREAWCHARVRETEDRLAALPLTHRTVLMAHFPLRRRQLRLLGIPGFAPWCGTTLTEDWHIRYRAAVVVTGHLHIPGTTMSDGVRFEEVSLGYPREWAQSWRRERFPRVVLPYTTSVTGAAL